MPRSSRRSLFVLSFLGLGCWFFAPGLWPADEPGYPVEWREVKDCDSLLRSKLTFQRGADRSFVLTAQPRVNQLG